MEIFNNLQNKGLLLAAYGVIITLAGSEKQPCSIFGALAQLVEQAISCLSPMPSSLAKQLMSDLHKIWQEYLGH